jgi:hypothetical protein
LQAVLLFFQVNRPMPGLAIVGDGQGVLVAIPLDADLPCCVGFLLAGRRLAGYESAQGKVGLLGIAVCIQQTTTDDKAVAVGDVPPGDGFDVLC